jgi:hypothetical protein
MENLNEQIKDPNQLDMFAGVLLTSDQQEKVNTYIENCKKNSEFTQKKHLNIVGLLLINGFCKDTHFEESCKTTIETRKVTLGYNYNNTAFETEVTAEYSQSDIYLLGQSFDSWKGKVKPTKFYFDVEKDKIQCSSITEQYRYYKPRTLLEKLKEHNENAMYRFEEYQKKTNLEKNVIEKYTKLYPNATITTKDDYSKYSGSYRVVEVKFESGSYIQFKLDTYNLKEYLYKKYDATFEKLTAEELLEKFNNQ